jgi:hypothetical protein
LSNARPRRFRNRIASSIFFLLKGRISGYFRVLLGIDVTTYITLDSTYVRTKRGVLLPKGLSSRECGIGTVPIRSAYEAPILLS